MTDTTNQFKWMKFYSEFANQLLKYKNNRQELLEILQTSHQEGSMK